MIMADGVRLSPHESKEKDEKTTIKRTMQLEITKDKPRRVERCYVSSACDSQVLEVTKRETQGSFTNR